MPSRLRNTLSTIEKMLKVSARSAAMPASAIRKLVPFSEAAEAAGVKVYHLNVGAPDIKSPDCAIEAARNRIPSLLHVSYTNSAGLPELRRAMCEKYYKSIGLDIKLPEIQKTLIRKVVAKGKYVITATQMLESMTTSPRPTRAEISDVANAVYDGTSAVMLSGESAAGKYPVESVKALDAICTEAENNGEFAALHQYISEHSFKDSNVIRGSVCRAAKSIADEVGAKAIIVESATGKVARAMVHYRPEVPVIAVVTSQIVCRKLCFNWGVTALIGEEKLTSDAITKQAMEKAMETGLVKKGDTVVVLSSNKTIPTSSTDSLNIRIL